MAVDINLDVYRNSSPSGHLGCFHLYFGQSIRFGSMSGWDWVEANGMKVESPSVYGANGVRKGKVVSKETLQRWIREGYLSSDPLGRDTSGDFLNEFPASATYTLSFVDWS